jgi:hypothetical protein
MSIEEKAKTFEEIGKDIVKVNPSFSKIAEEMLRFSKEFKRLHVEKWVRLEDAQQDKQDTLKTAWSTLEDECKRIQDEIDRGCYSNPLDIIFEVHATVSKCFEELLKEKKEAKPCA